MSSETLTRRTGCLNWARPGLWGLRVGNCPVLPGVPPSLLLGKAVGYSLKQWDKLVAYLESSYLTPDNNAAENAIRPFVLGRKNWLFCQSTGGAESSCGMYTLIQTANQNGLVSFNYLTALFKRAPYASSPEDWEKLLPWNIFKS